MNKADFKMICDDLDIIEYVSKGEDSLASVRNELIQEHQSTLLRVPKDLTQTYAKAGGWAGMVSGMAAGATLGAHIGIATLGTGFAATIPLGIIGGIMGYFGGGKIGDNFEK